MSALAIWIAVCPFALIVLTSEAANRWTSRSGLYVVSYTSELEPLVINKIHSWVIHVEDSAGRPVDNAALSVVGGMPQHNHGLPTKPRMTKFLGAGNYVLEGMRFHMTGYWEISVTIDIDGQQVVIIIPLTL